MRIQLTRSASLAVRRGHPWVYRDQIPRTPGRDKGLATGAAVDLVGDDGRALGRALWDATSPIAARVFGDGEALDARGLARRITRSIERRDRWFADEETSAYRLCNGEGDRVPGFVLDRYGDAAVVRLDTDAWAPHLEAVVRALVAPLGDRGVRSIALRIGAEGAGEAKLRALSGPMPPERVVVREHGLRMEVDLWHGQKTGAFLDQRDNRARVRALAARKHGRVLNLFSYAGGFSLAAAMGGAERVVSVDVAARAHATAQRSFRENGVDPSAHAFVSADAFAFLEQARTRGERFDLVVSDPPSFAPSERAKPKAMAAYRKLHAAIAGVLAEGAIFCASSCSSHVPLDDFLATLDDASLGRGDLVVREIHGQPADHPTLPAWPEGRYLKFVVLS